MYERIISTSSRRSSCTQASFEVNAFNLRQDFRILWFKTFARNELAETRLEIAAITGGEFDEDEEGEGEEAELQRQIL